jgi:hypothetical protein
MLFYVGLDNPASAQHFDRACISVRRLRRRMRKPVDCPEVLLDSGAFSELVIHGKYQHSVAEYAAEIRRLHNLVKMVAVVAQDYMCEPFILARTGLTVADHQRLTIERYDALIAEALPVPIIPVLQGYRPSEYVDHLRAYGPRLTVGMQTGVGSICKRNGTPAQIINVLYAIKSKRPDLRLHGFGVKITALKHPGIRGLLHSADSMAWSYAARRQGRNQNDWREAQSFAVDINQVASRPATWWQPPLFY